MDFIEKIKTIGSDKKRLLDNFLSLGALQVANYVIPLITLPYLARVLGVEKFGLVFFAYAFCQYFNILTDFGFNLSAVREIAVNRENPEKTSEIFSSVIIVKGALLIISFLILSLVVLSVDKFRSEMLVYFFTFIMVLGNALYPVWFFQGIERMKYITFLNITSKLIFLVLIFIMVKASSDYILVPVLNSLGFLISGIIGLFIALKKFKIKLYLPNFKTIYKYFKHSSEFFLSRVSVSLYTCSNVFVLGILSTNQMAGLYVAAEKLYQAFQNIYFPLNSTLYPYMSKEKNIKFYKKLFFIATVLNLVVTSSIFIFAENIIILFYGNEMIKSVELLRIFAITLSFLVPSILLGYPFLAALGHSKQANNSVIIGSCMHVLGIIILILLSKVNIYNLCIMVLITEFLVFSIRCLAVKKYKLWSTK